MLRRTAWTAALVAAVLAAAGCTVPPAWHQVHLPSDVQPASLAVTDDGLLVGGQRAGRPVLVRLTGVTAGREFQLDPNEPAAEDAELIAVSAEGDQVSAIGRWFGGAHSNPRLTMWEGTAGSNLLTSYPQEFWTFGGHDAGNLLGIEQLAGRPVIFGLRSESAGIEGVVWTRAGHTWTKHPGLDPSLLSNPDRVVSFTALDRLDDRLVVAGDEVGLAGGLTQRPSVWVGSPDGPWTQALLPIPDDLPPASGQLSRATSIACADGAGCWVAGWVRGRAAIWSLTIGADGAITAALPTLLPGTPPPEGDPTALVTLVAGHPLVSTGADAPGLQLGCPNGWQGLAPPAGVVTLLQASVSGVYAITGDTLQRLELPSC